MAVPTLLTMQFIDDSNRPGIAYGVAAAGSLAPVNFITMLAPNFFGSLDWNYDYWGPGYETMVDPDWTDRAINYLFIGTLPALLVFWHGLAGGRLFGRRLRVFFFVGLGALLYAVGRSTPVFAWAFDLVPGISLYRRPADATFILNFAVAMACGYLVHRYVAEGAPNPFRRLPRSAASGLAAAAVVLIGLIVGFALLFPATSQQTAAELHQLAIAIVIAAAGAALLLFRAGMARCGSPRQRSSSPRPGPNWSGAMPPPRSMRNRRSAIPSMPKCPPTSAPALRCCVVNSPPPPIVANTRGSRFSDSSVAGRTPRWSSASKIRSATIRCASPLTNVPSARARTPSIRTHGVSPARSAATDAISPRCSVCRSGPRPASEQIATSRATAEGDRDFAGEHIHIYKLGTVAPRAYLATELTPIDDEAVFDTHTLPESTGHAKSSSTRRAWPR